MLEQRIIDLCFVCMGIIIGCLLMWWLDDDEPPDDWDMEELTPDGSGQVTV